MSPEGWYSSARKTDWAEVRRQQEIAAMERTLVQILTLPVTTNCPPEERY